MRGEGRAGQEGKEDEGGRKGRAGRECPFRSGAPWSALKGQKSSLGGEGVGSGRRAAAGGPGLPLRLGFTSAATKTLETHCT